MKKKIIKILIIIGCIIAGLLLIHLTVNYLVPFIQDMHRGMF